MIEAKLLNISEKFEDCDIELSETTTQKFNTKAKDILIKKKYLEDMLVKTEKDYNESMTKFNSELAEINNIIDQLNVERNKPNETKEKSITTESVPV